MGKNSLIGLGMCLGTFLLFMYFVALGQHRRDETEGKVAITCIDAGGTWTTVKEFPVIMGCLKSRPTEPSAQ